MIANLIVLAPPVIMAGLVLIGVAWFIRSQMTPGPRIPPGDSVDDIPADVKECQGEGAGQALPSAAGGHFEPNSDQDGRR